MIGGGPYRPMYAGQREAAVIGPDGRVVDGMQFDGRAAARMAERACDALNAAWLDGSEAQRV